MLSGMAVNGIIVECLRSLDIFEGAGPNGFRLWISLTASEKAVSAISVAPVCHHSSMCLEPRRNLRRGSIQVEYAYIAYS